MMIINIATREHLPLESILRHFIFGSTCIISNQVEFSFRPASFLVKTKACFSPRRENAFPQIPIEALRTAPINNIKVGSSSRRSQTRDMETVTPQPSLSKRMIKDKSRTKMVRLHNIFLRNFLINALNANILIIYCRRRC
jgi:hypothetical protein